MPLALYYGVPPPTDRYLTIILVLMHPVSRGSIHISSSNPLSHPKIDTNYLSHDVEVEIVVKAFNWIRGICKELEWVLPGGGSKGKWKKRKNF
jgi:choline dehydrogenase-like flavoprotein